MRLLVAAADDLAHAIDRRFPPEELHGEHETEDGEAQRDDERFATATAWEYPEEGLRPDGGFTPHDEPLTFNEVQLATRSYK